MSEEGALPEGPGCISLDVGVVAAVRAGIAHGAGGQ